jgi:hypothetical protein
VIADTQLPQPALPRDAQPVLPHRGAFPTHSHSCAYQTILRGWQPGLKAICGIVGVEDGLVLHCGEAVVSSRIRSDFGLLGERVRRRPTHCIVDEVHPGIVLSWSSGSSGWVALVAYGDESGVLHVGPLPAARLRPV